MDLLNTIFGEILSQYGYIDVEENFESYLTRLVLTGVRA